MLPKDLIKTKIITSKQNKIMDESATDATMSKYLLADFGSFKKPK